MAKKSRPVLTEPRMKPTLYFSSQDFKIPKSIKGKLGKTVNLTVKARVISQRLSREPNRKQIESYDLEIQRIKSSGARNVKGKRN